MHKAYQDKKSGLWKWGTRGEAKYETKRLAEQAGIDIVTKRLREVRDQVYDQVVDQVGGQVRDQVWGSNRGGFMKKLLPLSNIYK